MNTIKQAELNQHKHRITHLQGEANYTFVHFVDEPRLLLSSTLSLCHRALPGFIRIHRKYAINPDFAWGLQLKLAKPQIILHTHCLSVSRRLLKDVRQALANPGVASPPPKPRKPPKPPEFQLIGDFYRDIRLTWK